jgi:antitoxin ChpS
MARRIAVTNVTTLKTAGGSLIMTVPANVRKALSLVAGTRMSISVEGSGMVVEAIEPDAPIKVRRPKYTLEELLADCNPEAPMSEEERAWHNAPPVGREIW